MFKKELFDEELDQVTGGTVVISQAHMMVGFTTTGEMYDLKGCTFKQARDLRDDLLEQNPGIGNRAFDTLCKQAYAANGWIVL